MEEITDDYRNETTDQKSIVTSVILLVLPFISVGFYPSIFYIEVSGTMDGKKSDYGTIVQAIKVFHTTLKKHS